MKLNRKWQVWFSNYYLEIVKCRVKCHCQSCKKDIPPNSYCFKKRQIKWVRYCLTCGAEYCKRQIKNLKDIINHLKRTIKALEIKKDFLNNANMLASLGEEK